MGALWASFCKDFMLLWRDRAGLAILFIMPMALVLVVSLVQNNILEATGQKAFKVLFVDPEQSQIGNQLRQRLAENGGMVLVTALAGHPLTRSEAREHVAKGNYQFAILLSSKREQYQQGDDPKTKPDAAPAAKTEVEVCFDPAVQGVFRTAVLASLRLALLEMEVQQRSQQLAPFLSRQLAPSTSSPPTKPLFQVHETPAGNPTLRPNAVQQNVPAWSLFGMFFIVVPLGGALLRERQLGTLQRLFCFPVSAWSLLFGKLLAYVTVCQLQFGLMLLVGRYLLPALGTPVLQMGDHPGAIAVLGLVSALAATGYGLIVGVLARSYEQASMFGAISIVIAAAIGGVMVPVYVMPPAMQRLSQLSPINWGLEGFLELFVRGGDITSIWPHLVALLAFFGATLTCSLWFFNKRHRYAK